MTLIPSCSRAGSCIGEATSAPYPLSPADFSGNELSPTPGPSRSGSCSVTAVPSRMQVPPNCDLLLGAVCVDKSVPGRTAWTMLADERFANPAGLVQGGFLCAFIDTALGSAAVTFVEGRKVFAVNAD